MSNMNILVTGAAGFIGSHTVLSLLETGFKVIAVDNCINAIIGEQETLPESLKRVENLSGVKLTKFYNVDLTDAEKTSKMFKTHSGQISAVIHLAALKAVGESCVIPLRYYENNILATINLVRAMQDTGVNKLIFSSSATVYGTPQYLPLDENHPTGVKITNPYGRTKYFIEEILKDVVESSNFAVKNSDSKDSSNSRFNVISLRYFNPVGAHESGEIGEDPRGVPNNLMPFIAQVAVGRRAKLSVFGSDFNTPDGTGVRDYIHISDLASGHVVALKRILSTANVKFEVFNLGSGKGHSVLEVLSSFSAACGKPIPHELVNRRSGDVDCIYAECTKARDILKWETKKTLDQMCIDTWRWQSKYPHGFQTENNNIYSTPSCQ